MLKAISVERLKSLVCVEVKDGSMVLSWHDVSCVGRALKTQFSSLFRVACFKDATMQEVVC